MQVSNPNLGSGKVENKKSSLFGSLLGFFYNHTKGILLLSLAVIVVFAFTSSFIKEMNVYKAVRFSMMNPRDVIFIGLVDAVFSVVKMFVPLLFVCVFLKLFMIKKRGLKIEYVFNKAFKFQLLFSFVLSFIFTVLFFVDVLVLTHYSVQLIKTSVEIFVMSFMSLLMTVVSFYGVLRGIDFVIEKRGK